MENIILRGLNIGYLPKGESFNCAYECAQSETLSGLNSTGFSLRDELNLDMVLCGFSCLPETDLNAEISGDSVSVAQVVTCSTILSTVVFCGLKTHLGGLKHLSCVVSNGGRLIDIVDRTRNLRLDEYALTNKIKVYNTPKAVVGLLIDTDILLEENWKKIAPITDVIISVAKDMSGEEIALLAKYSAKYKLPYFVLSDSGVFWSD